MNGESQFVKEMDFFASHHLKHAEGPDAPPDVSSQKDAIFRNIDDIKSFHSKWAHLLTTPGSEERLCPIPGEQTSEIYSKTLAAIPSQLFSCF